MGGKGSDSFPSWQLIAVVKDQRWPPLGGDLRQRALNPTNRSQVARSLISLTRRSRMDDNFFAAGSLEALGILLIILTAGKGLDGGEAVVEAQTLEVESRVELPVTRGWEDGGCGGTSRFPGDFPEPGQRA